MRKFAFAALLILAAPALAAPLPPAQLAPVAEKQLDGLFRKLAKAGSPEAAKPIEEQILGIFHQSGSASIDLLMNRAAIAEEAGDHDTAAKLLESVTDIAPGFAEGWHARGEMAQDANNDAAALVFLNKAVSLNPKHFQAYSELGQILGEYGDKKQALQYMRKALALDPYLEGLDKQVQQLARKVEGEKI